MGLIECTIDELFDEAVRRFDQETAVIYKDDAYSWRELDTLSDMMADRLEARGVVRGDCVGLWGENSAAWIVTFVALQKLGAVAALLNSGYLRRELVQIMRSSETRWLCYGSTPAFAKEADLIEAVAAEAGESLQGLVDIREETLGLRKMLEEAPDYAGRARDGLNCRDVACMLYTTGTTMEPKCVQHNHYSLVNNAIATAERARITAEDRICLSQPLFHTFPLCSSLLASFFCGSVLCVLSRFTSEEILCCVQRHRCTVLNGVPMNFLCMFSSQIFRRYQTDSLRLSIIGGDSISEAQYDYIRQTLPTVHIMRNYGLTEGCNLCNSEYFDSPKMVARSVGRPYPCIELAIQDPKKRTFLPPGEKGEIVTRGYNVMQGYFHSRSGDQPVQPIDESGWLRTGDLGILDKEGYLTIVGRLKDIIIRGGENVSPAEIEKEILRYEPVLDALVIGAPHPILGEEVLACLVLDSPVDYNEHELLSILKVRLAKFKIPAFFLLYDKFPLRPNGKVDMRALREDAYAKARVLHKDDKRYNAMLQQGT